MAIVKGRPMGSYTAPWMVVQTAREAASDLQVTANGYLAEVAGRTRRYPPVASPAQFDGAPPGGARPYEILRELGWTPIRSSVSRRPAVL